MEVRNFSGSSEPSTLLYTENAYFEVMKDMVKAGFVYDSLLWWRGLVL